MINKEERKYIREALRLVKLTKEQQYFTDGRLNAIIEVIELADQQVKKLNIHTVSNSFYCQDKYYDAKEQCKKQCVTCLMKE